MFLCVLGKAEENKGVWGVKRGVFSTFIWVLGGFNEVGAQSSEEMLEFGAELLFWEEGNVWGDKEGRG